MRLTSPYMSRSVLVCVLALMVCGCQSLDRVLGPSQPELRPDFNPPPLDAYALSAGKITQYKPMPGLPSSPTAKTMLLACRQIKVDSHSARSAFVVVTTGEYGKDPLDAVVVGNKILVLPTELATMGITSGGTADKFILYPHSATEMIFTVGSRKASVGNKEIKLSMPIVGVDSQLVTTLPDMLRIFAERDRQRHQRAFIRNVRIIYDLRDE